MDIEGGEVELLGRDPLPSFVRAICVELHPAARGSATIQGLLTKLIGDGFALDLGRSVEWVAFLERPSERRDC